MTTKTALFSLAAAAALTGTAGADTTRSHGGLCAPKDASRNLVGVDERGMYNAATTGSALVTCLAPNLPMHTIVNQGGFTLSSLVSKLRVWGRDLSATVPFSCYPFATYAGTFTSWGPTRYVCSQYGGCPDSTSEYTGANAIEWDVTSVLGLTAGLNGTLGIVCSIPPATSAGSSYVKEVDQDDSMLWNFDATIVQF